MPDKCDSAKRAEELREQIDRHDRLSYVENEPETSDREYDEPFAELQQLEAQHPEILTQESPTQRGGLGSRRGGGTSRSRSGPFV